MSVHKQGIKTIILASSVLKFHTLVHSFTLTKSLTKAVSCVTSFKSSSLFPDGGNRLQGFQTFCQCLDAQ